MSFSRGNLILQMFCTVLNSAEQKVFPARSPSQSSFLAFGPAEFFIPPTCCWWLQAARVGFLPRPTQMCSFFSPGWTQPLSPSWSHWDDAWIHPLTGRSLLGFPAPQSELRGPMFGLTHLRMVRPAWGPAGAAASVPLSLASYRDAILILAPSAECWDAAWS